MKLFFDACAIIYGIEMAEPFYSEFTEKLEQINRKYPAAALAVSRLSILECLVKPVRERNRILIKQYEDFFNHPGLFIVEMTPEVVSNAIHIRANTKLKTPDAIQAASALSLGKNHCFLSNDRVFEQVDGLGFFKVLDSI